MSKYQIDTEDGHTYEIETEDQPEQGLSDVPGNAMKDAGALAETARRAGQGIIDFPQDVYQTGKGMMNGQSFKDTPIGQDVQTVGNAALEALPHGVNENGSYKVEPGSIFRQYQDLAAEPLKHIPGKIGETMKQAYPGNPLIEHPLNSALAVAPLLGPAANAVREIPGVDAGLNAASDSIRQNIVAPAGRRALGKFPLKMPIEEANQVGLDAVDKGVVTNPITSPLSSSRKSMLGRANDLNESLGEHIGDFLKGQGEGLDSGKATQELDQVKGQFADDPAIVEKVEKAKNLISINSSSPVQDPINPTSAPRTMNFSKGNKIKGIFQDKVDYFSPKAAQKGDMAIAGNFRNSIDTQLDELTSKLGNREGMQSFLKDKKDFGSTRKMEDALTGQVNRDARNNPASLPSVIVGAAKGIPAGLLAEWSKRYGSATAATMANDVAKFLTESGSDEISNASKAGAALPSTTKRTLTKEKAKEFLDQANGDKDLARQLATKADYSW